MKTIDFNVIDSTSLYLKRSYKEHEDLTFVSALYQSHGKGRNDRKWDSKIGNNLLFSVLIKDESIINNFASLSILSAVSIFNVLKSLNIANVSIKWPNDVYVNDLKICGILLEGISFDNKLQALVLGIGLNVNEKDFASFNLTNATSICLVNKKEVDLSYIKQLVYNSLLTEILKLKNNDTSYLEVFRKHNYLKDKEVYAYYLNNRVKVKVIDINEDNTLKVLYENNIINISSGEITFHLSDKEAY